MVRRSPLYTVLFTVLLCTVCSFIVSTVSVSLRERQEGNRRLLGQARRLLAVAGLIEEGENLSREDIAERVFSRLEPHVVHLQSGSYSADIDAVSFDQRQWSEDPTRNRQVPENPAQVRHVPTHGRVFHLRRGDTVDAIILPIEGKGLWGTMYGYIALAGDARTIRGITFYEHTETPGLGAEIDNPSWQARWRDRLAFDEAWTPRIRVVKGAAGKPQEDPYRVDGISGSTITCDGVTHAVHFWLGDQGFGPYLRAYRSKRTGE